MHGLDWEGNPIIDPHTGKTTVYPVSGDPVTGEGWYDGPGWPPPDGQLPGSDISIQVIAGSFQMAPGDSQEIVIAIIIAQGDDYLDSVTKLKEKAAAVRQFYFTGDLTGIGDPASAHPTSFHLEQNYPNPFNPRTVIKYQLSSGTDVDLSVFNVLGQRVITLVSEKQKAGHYQVEWDASGVASGVYFYRMSTSDGFVQAKKCILLR
jgi:hypothetical protein